MLRYKYINGTSEADYAILSLQKWRKELKESLTRKQLPTGPGLASPLKKKKKKKKLKAKKMFAKMGLGQRQEEEEDNEEGGENAGEDGKLRWSNDSAFLRPMQLKSMFNCNVLDGDDVSLDSLSMDGETRMKLANLGTQLSTSNKGGYKGLGFASEFETVQEVDSYDCNAAITAALLTGGATSLFEKKSPKKGDKTEFKKTSVKKTKKSDGTDRAIFQKLKLKYKEPQDVIDRRMMAEKEGKYMYVLKDIFLR